MKRKKLALLLAPVLALSLFIAGCSKKTVVDIQRTATYETEDVYTVTYSDGSVSNIVIKNGKDGKDGTASVNELYSKYRELHPDATYEEFLQNFLNVTLEEDSSAVIGRALQSCFTVYAELRSLTTGSAVLYQVQGDDAYIITNYHVVYGVKKSSFSGTTYGIANSIHCYLYGSTDTPQKSSGLSSAYDYGEYGIPCEYLGGSINCDIAVLKASYATLLSINPGVTPVTVAPVYSVVSGSSPQAKEVASCAVGETAIAIGNTEGEGISATKGIVSIDSEYIALSIDNVSRSYRSMRIDAAIYKGNSGGGLFNGKGELIGITNAGDEEDQNINYAVPLPIVTGIADNVIHYYNDGDADTRGAYKITLGIESVSEKSRYVYDAAAGKGKIVEDIRVENVSGIASGLGLRKNDVITTVEITHGGVPTLYRVNRAHEIRELLYTVRSGDTVKIGYKRSGTAYTTDDYTVKSSDLSKLD